MTPASADPEVLEEAWAPAEGPQELFPRFSIFIPVRNGGTWIRGAIESVLAQTYPSWELVVGDNASTDGLAAVLARYRDERVRCHRWLTRADLCENFNRTMRLARYEWIQPLCADDRLDPRCLEKMAARVRAGAARRSRLSIVVAAARRLDASGRPADEQYYGYRGRARIPDGVHDAASWLRHSMTGVTPWNLGAVAFARDVIDEMGSFMRPEVGLCADVEVVLRASAYGDVAYIDEPLMDYVVRGSADSQTRGFSELAWAQPLPPLATALAAGFAVHQARRAVSPSERTTVARTVSAIHTQRALQHRYCAGGAGRRGALRELRRALAVSPRTALRPTFLLYGLGALVCPRRLIRPLRSALLARSYSAASAAGPAARREDGTAPASSPQPSGARRPPAPHTDATAVHDPSARMQGHT